MKRRINPEIVARPSVTSSAPVAKARTEKQPDDAPTAESEAPAATLGISDAAGTRDVRAGLTDRLAGLGESLGTGDADSGTSGETGDLSMFAGAAPTGADKTIADAQAGLAGRLEAPSLTDGPERVDADTAIADAKAGLPGSGLRGSANSMLFDEAANDTTPIGIAEQGSAAVSESAPGPGNEAAAAKAAAAQMAAIAGTVDVESSDQPNGSASTNIATDPAFASNPLVKFGKGANEHTTGRSIREANAVFEDAPPPPAAAPAGPAGPASQTTGGGMKFTHPDGKTTILNRDGTVVEKSGSTTKITRPDESSVTQSTDDEGNTTIVERDPSGATTGTTPVGIPDPEGGDDRFRVVSEGLEERLGPRGVEGGGDIDFGDDIAFGVGAGAQLGDHQGTLLGDAGRAGAVAEGPATSGFTGLDPVRNSGAVDFEDESPIGGGLEDDPLADTGPQQNLDGGLTVTDDEADEADSTESTDPEAGGA